MSSVINFICSPGIGHLDNSFPLIVGLRNYTKKNATIFFTKESMVNHLINNPTLLSIHKKTFNKNYVQIKNIILTSDNLEKLQNLLNNKMLKFFLFRILIPLRLKIFYFPILKKFKVGTLSLKKIFNPKDIIIFDPFEIIQNKEYIKQIYLIIENNFKIGIRHGVGNDQIKINKKVILKKNSILKNKKTNIKNIIYLSHSKKQTQYIRKTTNINFKKILNSGVLKYSGYWKSIIKKETFNKKFNQRDDFVYIISRHTTKYFSLKKKIELIKLLKETLIEKFNLKLIIKFHPKEDPKTALMIYNMYLGSKNYNKTWFLVNQHSFKICEICKFGISFVSSVTVDLLSYNKFTIEILNLKNKKSKNNYNLSFTKNKLVLVPKNIKDFERIIEMILIKKINHSCFKKFNELYYKPDYPNTIKTISRYYNEYCCNLR